MKTFNRAIAFLLQIECIRDALLNYPTSTFADF